MRDLEIGAMIDEARVQFLRVRVELIDDSLLYVREAIFPHTSKYSYHWQTRTGEMLLRWDNAPHHPAIPTHPHHKHDGERIGPAARVSIDDFTYHPQEAGYSRDADKIEAVMATWKDKVNELRGRGI